MAFRNHQSIISLILLHSFLRQVCMVREGEDIDFSRWKIFLIAPNIVDVFTRAINFLVQALVSVLDKEEMAHLRDQFNTIDLHGTGKINLDEMRQALAKNRPWSFMKSKGLDILQAVDTNNDGFIDFEEFVSATLHVNQLERFDNDKWNRLTLAAFQMFDSDNDGYITPEELKVYTGLKGSIGHLLDEADINKDGRISLREFQRLLKNAYMDY
ncbi:hypothetical protein KP509_1Z179400 [Ceratopteris richardii]|nr:hypothetical protein KP509_1Z179400 [Ceratopteris richardii]